MAEEPTEKFPQFDVVTDYSDHKFAESTPLPITGRLLKNITKEWKMLMDGLPESIYVRVYEGRMELLRAVIVGASGTPYHNGLFFFDFAFPFDYPNEPPTTRYISFGYTLNPNLYKNGHVCLSILDTWYGPSWKPGTSSMLQILLSLQALVLNEKPFFNEAGFGLFKGRLFESESRRYNYEVYEMLWKAMLTMLRHKPKNFEGFIVEHFRSHGRVILTACKVYTEGFLRVGHYQDDTTLFLPERVHVPSSFKETMNFIYSGLVGHFTRNDNSLWEFIPKLDLMVEKTRDEYIQKDNEGKKIRKTKFFGMLKKFFGLNMRAKGNATGTEAKSSSRRFHL